MTERVVFGNTILKGINKAGTLKPDADGYYTVVLGALGVQNSVGEIYVNTDTARKTFEDNQHFMRRVTRGLLRGEWGHPDPSEYPNMTAFGYRVRQIKEDKISHHIREVWLEEIEYQGRKVLGILGKVRPTGPYGPALQKMFDNKHENVTFSGRYYSNVDQRAGQTFREIHTCVTWDFVSEPGIEMAQKFASPSLESAHEYVVTPQQLLADVKREEEMNGGPISMESGIYSAKDLYADLGFDKVQSEVPVSMRW